VPTLRTLDVPRVIVEVQRAAETDIKEPSLDARADASARPEPPTDPQTAGGWRLGARALYHATIVDLFEYTGRRS